MSVLLVGEDSSENRDGNCCCPSWKMESNCSTSTIGQDVALPGQLARIVTTVDNRKKSCVEGIDLNGDS